jgi:hypothetical protein
MGVMYEIVGSIVTVFAFHPLRCAVVAVMFTITLFIPRFSVFLKMTIGLAATSCWAFCWLDAVTPEKMNIRVDLFILGPYFVGVAIVGISAVVVAIRRSRLNSGRGINDR